MRLFLETSIRFGRLPVGGNAYIGAHLFSSSHTLLPLPTQFTESLKDHRPTEAGREDGIGKYVHARNSASESYYDAGDLGVRCNTCQLKFGARNPSVDYVSFRRLTELLLMTTAFTDCFQSEDNTYGFELPNKAACKHLWKCCVDHHSFFR